MLENIKKSFSKEIKGISDLKNLEHLRVKYLGRKGELTQILRSLKDLSIEKRRQIGPLAQKLKKEIEEILTKKLKNLKTKNLELKPIIDFTKPGEKIKLGHLHPLTKIDEEIRQIFLSMNFSVVEGPEVENEHYNFDALNIPPNHPARDMWDTFWLKEPKNSKFKIQNSKLLLRTHTSPVQIRYMETHNPPFQIIAPGRCFRYEATDASHETTFHQVEGLMIGKNITLANLKGLLTEFMKKFYGNDVKLHWQPSYFPFVEPGLELLMGCTVCNGKGCSVCGQTGWIEVIPCGMVHRNVLENVKLDPREWQGFAFGMGLDRIAMMKYKIDDIRLFYSGDLRFIKQF
ncbi:MAG: phenylalanine--tRNA ligase subunit alpha [Candidatus Paceibacterota bacterium]